MSQSFREYQAIHRNLRAVRELREPITIQREPWWRRVIRMLWGVR